MEFKYQSNDNSQIEEMVRYDTVYRLSGGFNVNTEVSTMGDTIPTLAPLNIDMKTRKATPLIRVRVKESGSGKKLKVSKGYSLTKGLFLSNGIDTLEVVRVDTQNPLYDEITAKADTANFALDTVLFEATDGSANTPKGTANFLCYAGVLVKQGAVLSAIARGYEVVESKLTIPVIPADKASLSDRFLFI